MQKHRISYNANDDEFENVKKIVDDFYNRYHIIIKLLSNATLFTKCIIAFEAE